MITNETQPDACARTLLTLRLKYSGVEHERNYAIQSISTVLVRLQQIDATLAECRAALVVLQPSRNGRVDLRFEASRTIPHAMQFVWVQWQGEKSKQHARRLPVKTAHRHVKHGRGAARTNYQVARKLAGQMMVLLAERRLIVDLLVELRALDRKLHSWKTIQIATGVLDEVTPRALTLLSVYASGKIGDSSAAATAVSA